MDGTRDRTARSPWTRRRLLTRTGGTATGAFALALLGCGGDSSTSEGRTRADATSVSTAAAEQPKAGGILNLGTTDDPLSLDLHQEQQAVTHTAYAPLYNQLVKRDPQDQLKLVADMAQSWSQPEPTVLTFALPTGAKWHDGSAFTSEDAAFSLQRVMTPPRGTASPWQIFLSSIDKIEAPDPQTVRLDLKHPSASLLSFLAMGWIVMLQKKLIEANGDAKRDAVGTGPFSLKAYRQGSVLELQRTAAYFKAPLPYLEGITTYIIKDPEAMWAQYAGKRIDVVGVTPNKLDEAKRMQGHTLHNRVGFPFAFYMNTSKPPFQDVRVRKAIDLIIDREEAVQLVGDGIGEIHGLFVPGADWGIPTTDVKQLPGYRQPKDQDRAEARRLLNAAGMGSGFKFTMTFRSTVPSWEAQALMFRDQLAPFGITGELNKVDTATETTMRRQGDIEGFPSVLVFYDLDPDSIFNYAFRINGPGNSSKFNDPEAERLMDAQSSAIDVQARKQLIIAAEQRIRDLVPLIHLFWPQGTTAVRDHVRDWQPGLATYTNNQREGVWLRS
jgi:peptide/nickel transport system substrate-binding protein